MRTLALPKAAEPWSLTNLREKLIKIGAKVVSHGRYVTFQMAEVAVSRQMFAEILSLIARRGYRRHQHEGRWDQMRPTTREVCLDANQRVSAPRRSQVTASTARHVPATRDLLLAKTPEGAIFASNQESEGCPVKWVKWWGYEE